MTLPTVHAELSNSCALGADTSPSLGRQRPGSMSPCLTEIQDMEPRLLRHAGLWPQVHYQKHLSLCPIRKEWELHHHEVAFAFAVAYRWGVANDHESLHRTLRPKFLLRRLIGMLENLGISYPREVPIIRLPLNRVTRELFLLIIDEIVTSQSGRERSAPDPGLLI